MFCRNTPVDRDCKTHDSVGASLNIDQAQRGTAARTHQLPLDNSSVISRPAASAGRRSMSSRLVSAAARVQEGAPDGASQTSVVPATNASPMLSEIRQCLW